MVDLRGMSGIYVLPISAEPCQDIPGIEEWFKVSSPEEIAVVVANAMEAKERKKAAGAVQASSRNAQQQSEPVKEVLDKPQAPESSPGDQPKKGSSPSRTPQSQEQQQVSSAKMMQELEREDEDAPMEDIPPVVQPPVANAPMPGLEQELPAVTGREKQKNQKLASEKARQEPEVLDKGTQMADSSPAVEPAAEDVPVQGPGQEQEVLGASKREHREKNKSKKQNKSEAVVGKPEQEQKPQETLEKKKKKKKKKSSQRAHTGELLGTPPAPHSHGRSTTQVSNGT